MGPKIAPKRQFLGHSSSSDCSIDPKIGTMEDLNPLYKPLEGCFNISKFDRDMSVFTCFKFVVVAASLTSTVSYEHESPLVRMLVETVSF